MQSDYLFKEILIGNSADVLERYSLKLKIIGDLDPYTIQSSELDFTVHSIYYCYNAIIDRLVESHSYYFKQQMKAYKSLQAHKSLHNWICFETFDVLMIFILLLER
ncbi:uncharacterized protein LOC114335688 [Diabrotica virgifera virgifera]|uniref:Uncharacterized protein n=1 Tax=Diabrotica virgifera virgifera TaxID=50390 RepID=A0ABM5KGP2_DIAVI|nr:uncharacterized protein LOC114335688 [Diabrotica virgifera virgifera]